SALFVAGRAMLGARRTRDGPMWELNLMAAAAFAGLLGFGIASIVLHAAYLRLLYVLVGIAAATDLLVRAHAGEARCGAWQESEASPASARAEIAAWVAGVAAFVLLCIPVAVLSLEPRWVGTVEAIVTPTPQPDDAQVFPNLELVYTRVLPNLASLAQSKPSAEAALDGLADTSARISAYRPLGTTALRVETLSTDQETARLASERVLENAVASEEAFGVLFEAFPLQDGRAQVQRQAQVDTPRLLAGLAFAFGLAVCVAVLTYVLVRRRLQRT
ncbi:MAG: hypothetical protein IT198_09445, partial [Acidimicrobiia bacterium]|nr:hypothetical protein [Acidimicrobiia bacterium]